MARDYAEEAIDAKWARVEELMEEAENAWRGETCRTCFHCRVAGEALVGPELRMLRPPTPLCFVDELRPIVLDDADRGACEDYEGGF